MANMPGIADTLQQGPPGTQYQTGGWTLRTSPLKYPELIAPPEASVSGYAGDTYPTGAAMAKAVGGSYGIPQGIMNLLTSVYQNDPASVYSSTYDNPVTQQHERIHVGQYLSGYQEDPAMAQSMMQAAPNWPRQYAAFVHPGLNVVPTAESRWVDQEAPAYAFENTARIDPRLFAQYMNNVHLRALNPPPLEASMPQDQLRRYLQTTPVPYRVAPPTGHVKEIK